MEGTGDRDASTPASGASSTATPEFQDDHAASASSTPAATPRRMKLRSQDTMHPDQAGIDFKKLDYTCGRNNFIMTRVTLVFVNDMRYRVRELPLSWLYVLEVETHQAPVKSCQVP